jgi:hypothetical protein
MTPHVTSVSGPAHLVAGVQAKRSIARKSHRRRFFTPSMQLVLRQRPLFELAANAASRLQIPAFFEPSRIDENRTNVRKLLYEAAPF